MILSNYLIKKFLNALFLCFGASYVIFFIFSLIGNLSEKLSFNLILYLSMLNSFQIFTYIPSHLFILSFFLFIVILKAKNELIIIKGYINLRNLFFIILPILALFIFIEIYKDTYSRNIEKIKSNILNSNETENSKIFISIDGSKKNYSIFNGFDEEDKTLRQYLSFDVKNQKILSGKISNNLFIKDNNLLSNESFIYENNNFKYELLNKRLFDNFVDVWLNSYNRIIKNKENNSIVNFNIIQSIVLHSLFYSCISMIFLSKKLVSRNVNLLTVFSLVLIIFLYYLLVPKIVLNNFQYPFQFISILFFVLIFFKIKQNE
jgi:hypothetical protein